MALNVLCSMTYCMNLDPIQIIRRGNFKSYSSCYTDLWRRKKNRAIRLSVRRLPLDRPPSPFGHQIFSEKGTLNDVVRSPGAWLATSSVLSLHHIRELWLNRREGGYYSTLAPSSALPDRRFVFSRSRVVTAATAIAQICVLRSEAIHCEVACRGKKPASFLSQYRRKNMVALLCLAVCLASVTELRAFTVAPTLRTVTNNHKIESAVRLTTSQGFEFPDDHPERGSSAAEGRGISSSELRRMNEVRQQRLADEKDQASRFVTGEDLHELRQQVLSLRHELDYARKLKAKDRVEQLERAILKAQQVDAEFIYEVSLERMEVAAVEGRVEDEARYLEEAMKARKALPQFNLEGLWVGKYGEQGFEMINVTYVGDVLIARKVTGEKNVPQGEVTFQVDLSPKSRETVLDPIELGHEAADQWGTRFLSRFAGQGHVAAPGFSNSQWMEGQLILVNEYFSFAWLPIAHQVFFGRPSAELTLKLLRESRSKQFAGDKVREHLSRCWEETELIDEEMEVNGGLFHSHNQVDYYEQEGCFD